MKNKKWLPKGNHFLFVLSADLFIATEKQRETEKQQQHLLFSVCLASILAMTKLLARLHGRDHGQLFL
jgi:hypothetical protein